LSPCQGTRPFLLWQGDSLLSMARRPVGARSQPTQSPAWRSSHHHAGYSLKACWSYAGRLWCFRGGGSGPVGALGDWVPLGRWESRTRRGSAASQGSDRVDDQRLAEGSRHPDLRHPDLGGVLSSHPRAETPRRQVPPPDRQSDPRIPGPPRRLDPSRRCPTLACGGAWRAWSGSGCSGRRGRRRRLQRMFTISTE
jgi:hypothetical protein